MSDNQRIENFSQIKGQFENKGYYSKQYTISIIKANVIAFVTSGPIIVLCCLLFFLINPNVNFDISTSKMLLFYGIMLVSIFVHEYLHGLTWSLCCKNGWKSVHIGVIWKKITPYCCCMEPLNFRQYLIGGLMPFIVLGLGIFLIAIITGNLFWFLLSVINILAAGGDLTIALMLLKHRNALIIDDPTECGFWAFKKRSL